MAQPELVPDGDGAIPRRGPGQPKQIPPSTSFSISFSGQRGPDPCPCPLGSLALWPFPRHAPLRPSALATDDETRLLED